MSDNERAAFPNLMLMCYEHHVITNDVDTYKVPELQAIKAAHEARFTDPAQAILDGDARQLAGDIVQSGTTNLAITAPNSGMINMGDSHHHHYHSEYPPREADAAKSILAQPVRYRSQRSVDRKIFDAFLNVMPSQGFIRFIKEIDIGEHFHESELDQLRSFCRSWNDPEHEFLDDQIDAKRKRLYELADEYYKQIILNTFSSHPDGFIGIPREWRHKDPERYWAIVGELHDLADKMVNAHADLVRTGRARLGSEDPPDS
jgi:hypothetical protein